MARVLERLDALERENASWRAETARLARELSAVRAARPPRDPGEGQVGQPGDDGGHISRRGVLLGAAAAAGVAAASGVLGAQPALAADGGSLTLGSASNSASLPTGVAVSGTTAKYGIGATDNGLSAYPNVVPPAALLGHAANENFQAGVLGYSNNGMQGVVGRSDPIDSTGSPGVFGVGQPGVSGFGGGTSPGVVGTGNGTGVLGIGAPGIEGRADAYLDTGVQGTSRGTVLGSALFPAEGVGVLAECTDGGAGLPAAASIALSARNDGSGTGVKATSASGIPIWGQISNSANARAAVQGTTNGTGPAVRGAQAGKSGSAVSGQVSNAKNAAAAVLGTGSSIGRGGQFAGGAAQLRRVPSGTRPTSGQTGDLFVDSSGHLHYCKAGGSTASWVQLV